MIINPAKLSREITAAGIANSGCNEKGIVWGIDGTEIQDLPDVAPIIAAHDPTTYNIIPESLILETGEIGLFYINVDPAVNQVAVNCNGASEVVALENGAGVLSVSSDVSGVLVIVVGAAIAKAFIGQRVGL